jgi:hypothetical protein
LNLVGAASVLANHPIPTGTVACVAGQQVVTWTVTNSEFTVAEGGTGRTMKITALSVSQGTVSGIAVNDVLQPQSSAGSTETGTTTLPGTTTGDGVLEVTGEFFNPDGTVFVNPDGSVTNMQGAIVTLPWGMHGDADGGCPQGQQLSFRWHYSANGSSGSWSGTKSTTCPGSISEGPQAMEGALQVAPGTTLLAGYDFKSPGNSSTFSVTVTNPQVVFTVHCASGATPSQSTLTVSMPTATYTVTGQDWFPSCDQHSSIVYQGSIVVPNLCANGQIRLNAGGTFSASVS